MLSSCGEESTEFSKVGTKFVAFRGSSAALNESTALADQSGNGVIVGATQIVTVYRSTTDFSEALTVNLSITSEFTSSTDFQDAGDDASSTFMVSATSVIIPVGSSEATFSVSSVNDLFASGNKTVSIEITGTSDTSYELGFPEGAISSSYSISIVDDDCPIDINSWVGIYDVEEGFIAGAFEGISNATRWGETYEVELELDPTDGTGTRMIMTNTEGNNTFMADGTLLTFITCTSEVTFDPTPLQLALWLSFVPESTNYNEDQLRVTATGTYGSAANGTYEVKLTKQ